MGEQSMAELIRLELKKELRPFTFSEITSALNISNEELNSELDKNPSKIMRFKNSESDILIESGYNDLFKEKIIKILTEHHKKNPMFQVGLDINELSGKLNFGKIKHAKYYLDMLLQVLKDNGYLDIYKNTWLIKGHTAALDKQSEEEMMFLEKIILDYADEKPAIVEIEEKTSERKINSAKLKTYLSLLAQEKKIRYFQNDFIHSLILDKYRTLLLQNLALKENGVEVPEYKEILGGTKKFRALLTDIFEAEKIIQIKKISENETRFCITDLGRKAIGC